MTLPPRLKFGTFLAPFHALGENPTLSLHRDLELMEWLDELGFDEAWIGEHHSAGWETISSPELFIAGAAERTKHIKFGTGVISLPYHNPLMVANRMIQLDHQTRGRVMMGVGPGALTTDALMMGIDPSTQRPRMDEALGIILRLFTETEPITYKGEWFELKNARVHLRPFTYPHMPVAVAALQSPAGPSAAGKYGAGLLSLSLPRGGNVETALRDVWSIAETTAAAHGRTADRKEWRLVISAHLSDSRDQAFAEARVGAGRHQYEYFAQTLGVPTGFDGPPEEIIDEMARRDLWCIGTPDDLIAMIEKLDRRSGGFGGILIQANEWATREQVRHSYELMARYVMPRFQGSLENLQASQADAAHAAGLVATLRQEAQEKAKQAYEVNVPGVS